MSPISPVNPAGLDDALEQHKLVLDLAPYIADKLVLSSNGVRVDLIEELGPQERDPKRIHYSSSPDRGPPTRRRWQFMARAGSRGQPPSFRSPRRIR